MIVLGLDPGSRYTGYGVVEQEGSRLRELDSGRISLVSEPDMAARMACLAEGVEQALDRWQPAGAALETLFHGRNSRSLIALRPGAGRHPLGARPPRPEVEEVSPAEVKKAVCGNGRADKSQVARMVDVLLGAGAGRRSADASDALAVAICYVQQRPLQRVVEAARSAR